jgi:hypothetical protein
MSMPEDLRQYHGLSEEYWERIGERGRELYALVRPTPGNFYQVEVAVNRLQAWVEDNRQDLERCGGGVEMEPDFQRGHVWTPAQRAAFCESFIRGQAPALLMFNCPSYHAGLHDHSGDLPRHLMQCIDGLQRFTALTDYAADKVPVFGGKVCSDFEQSPFDVRRQRAQVRVYGLLTRAELLRFYIDLNSGGTVHSSAELARVQALLDEASAKPPIQALARKRRPA